MRASEDASALSNRLNVKQRDSFAFALFTNWDQRSNPYKKPHTKKRQDRNSLFRPSRHSPEPRRKSGFAGNTNIEPRLSEFRGRDQIFLEGICLEEKSLESEQDSAEQDEENACEQEFVKKLKSSTEKERSDPSRDKASKIGNSQVLGSAEDEPIQSPIDSKSNLEIEPKFESRSSNKSIVQDSMELNSESDSHHVVAVNGIIF